MEVLQRRSDVYSSLDFGEVYDASRENAVDGWSMADYDDQQWKNAVVVPLEGTAFLGADIGFGGRTVTPLDYHNLSLIGQIGNTAGVFRTLTAKSMKEVRPGVFVYDLGQNIVGVPRIRIANGRPGQTIAARYSEMLYPDLPQSGKNTGMIMTETIAPPSVKTFGASNQDLRYSSRTSRRMAFSTSR